MDGQLSESTSAPSAGRASKPDSRWTKLPQHWRDTGRLATAPPRVTAFMRYRAAQQDAGMPSPVSWVSVDQISPYLMCAVIAAEDPVFFRHRGICWPLIVRAMYLALKNRRPMSAVSSITQQLARNLYLYPERSMRRKLQEAVLARRIERVLNKAQILELYLNVVEWGEGIWGIAAAADAYFRRTPAELDPFHAIVLASLLPAPRAAMRDRNAERALREQRRLVYPLYGSGFLSLNEERQTLVRVGRLEQQLCAGVAFRDACHELAGDSNDPAHNPRSATVQEVLTSEAGYETLCSFARYLRKVRPIQRAMEMRPMWWSDAWESPHPTNPPAAM